MYTGDIFATDITEEILHTNIARDLGINYLSEATGDKLIHCPQMVNGYIFGKAGRSIIPFPISFNSPPRWVFFMFDTGAPQTFLTEQASKAIGVIPDPEEPGTVLDINGYLTTVFISPNNCLFAHINLLGTLFCRLNHVFAVEDYYRGTVSFHFGGKWKLVEKKGL
ncbi:hypothetical protein B9Z19DRAFT_1128524 [Tuber borchii]|uniref:Peptidase A1 domain-containing protein n=1 Tax=Tuber borchii TaxID=42251 RepID=A0A2T6ZPA9_TUBBO|nr:hypothetical protein B9Z19DRAFT_1128524 [Tuber borchii]